jgi:two-component sensor histidine kinase
MKTRNFLIFLALGIVAFIVDLFTPRGMGIWSVYVVLIVIYVKYAYNSLLVPLTVFYIIFSIAGYFFSPVGYIVHIALINRIASIIIIMVVAYLAHRESLIRKVNAEILDRISDSFIAVDKVWNISYANRVAENISFSTESLLGKNIWTIYPSLKGTLYEEYYKKAMATLQPVKFRAPGPYDKIDYEVSVYPSQEGLTIYGRDITELVKKETELQKTVTQKEMLVKEVHHRVKNNFQLISSLIRLSVLSIDDDRIVKTIADIENRIRALSLIHEQLYRGKSESLVDMNLYLHYLISQLEHLISPSAKISHNISIDNIDLDVDSAISIGLIVNELYSNSAKHGFRNMQQGEINIDMRFKDNNKKTIRLLYADNGIGIPEAESILDKDTMGLTIVRTLIEQSQGTINVSNHQGVKYDIVLNIHGDIVSQNNPL